MGWEGKRRELKDTSQVSSSLWHFSPCRNAHCILPVIYDRLPNRLIVTLIHGHSSSQSNKPNYFKVDMACGREFNARNVVAMPAGSAISHTSSTSDCLLRIWFQVCDFSCCSDHGSNILHYWHHERTCPPADQSTASVCMTGKGINRLSRVKRRKQSGGGR